MMTVKEIKEYFKDFPDDMVVISTILLKDTQDPEADPILYDVKFIDYASCGEIDGKETIALEFQFDDSISPSFYKMYADNFNKYGL